MANIALLLGPIAFHDFEVPASIHIGGAQRLAIHHLPGGARVIDVLGRDDADISFSGIFSGADATLRARSVDEMRVLGLPLPLTWDVFSYSVIIKQFEADYRSGWWIPYRITCTVVYDAASSVMVPAMALVDDVRSDVSVASTFAFAAGVDLSNAQRSINISGAAVRGTASYASTLATLASASAVILSSVTQVEGIVEATSWPSEDEIPLAVNTLNGIVSAAQQLSSLSSAQAYLGRASINLVNAST
jgi:hypothetical protein